VHLKLQTEASTLLELNAEVIGVKTFLSHPDCAPFTRSIHSRCSALPLAVQSQVYVAFLSSMLQKRHGASRGQHVTPDGDQEMRALCSSLLTPLVERYTELTARTPLDQGIQDLNVILTAIVRSVWSKSSSGRSIVYQCISPVVERNKALLGGAVALDEKSLQVHDAIIRIP
jgi:hypothetical protein